MSLAQSLFVFITATSVSAILGSLSNNGADPYRFRDGTNDYDETNYNK